MPTPSLSARTAALVLAALLVGPACAPADAPEAEPAPPVVAGERAVPAGGGALAPRLSLDGDGAPLLSWTEARGDSAALRYARWTGDGWGGAETADAGRGRFVNWADTPGVVALPGGGLVAHSLVLHPERDSPYAYDVRVRQGRGGAWGEPVTPHDDGVAAEHGFVSVVAGEGGAGGLVWLDGRNQGGGHDHAAGAMTLRYAALGPDGAITDAAELDARTCDCCPTAAVATPSGLVVAYRDRSPEEVRDIAVVRLVDGAWTEPEIPHADGWTIHGCPVNGPALAARGDRVALAWYTEGGGGPRVQVALSDDGGATFGAPAQVDGGAPLGRVGVALLPDGAAAVTWLERTGGAAEVRVRRVEGGVTAPPQTVATVPAGRESGVPVVAALGPGVVVAWTDPDATPAVRTAVVEV
ncbi:hypothetical protein [Rubrivirga litoralis]|uniref:Exo-alpha-sialidase n=1 Tax=Rubrivirga litoralis TaxID=3075598 RepID=A0ABU3BSI7_9BACT|nr:hypothetical protein [Rubrivirga sp. F394]MDT0632195.1 hypothetical protein [Rubrivirga sp. F394]